MYCFEAKKCSNEKCPVKAQRLLKCWHFFGQNQSSRESICKSSDCQKCHYKLGWEIGLISEDLFTSEESLSVPQLLNENNESPENYENSNIDVGKGKRFCYEIMECSNPLCPIRRKGIFKCFKYFHGMNQYDKEAISGCNRECSTCFYKSGWDLGLISEDNFEDIIQRQKAKEQQTSKHQQDLIVDVYMTELAKKPFLTKQEEINLAKKIAGDKKASELFLLANLKLVTQIANKYSSKIPLMDLIQEGNIGLIKAISKFDYRLGYKFSTYASYWIKYYMQKAVAEQKNTITIPCHLIAVSNKIKKQIQKFQEIFFRSPTLTELSTILNISESKIVNLLNVTRASISINTKISKNGEDEETIEYYLEDTKTLTPEEAFFEKQKAEAISTALNKLEERQRNVVKNYYGIDCDEISLAEIGRRLNISRERVRQILKNGLLKLQEEKSIIEYKN